MGVYLLFDKYKETTRLQRKTKEQGEGELQASFDRMNRKGDDYGTANAVTPNQKKRAEATQWHPVTNKTSDAPRKKRKEGSKTETSSQRPAP